MAIETRQLKVNVNVTIIVPKDTWSPDELHEALRNAVDSGQRSIVVNLSAVPRLDPERAGALDAGSRYAAMMESAVKLSNVAGEVVTALAVQRSGLLGHIFQNEAEAVLSFA